MDTFFLRLFFGILKLLPLSGVNLEQVHMIASTKLTMDRRRKPATWKRSQQKEPSNAMLYAMFLYALMGLFMGFMIFAVPDFMLAMIILHTYLLFMLIMILITDFSNVLLDTSDSQIILPKPVTSRTLLVARTLHIVVYLGQLILAIMICPVIATFFKYGGAVGFSLLLTTLLTAAIGIFITYILYGLVLRYTSEQRVKDIIGYFQVFMTVFFAVAYQVIPRLINLSETVFSFELHWYSYLLPPVWMAGLLDSVKTVTIDGARISMIVFAIGFPLLAGFVIAKYLAPYFSRFMSAPAEGGTLIQTKSARNRKAHLSEKLAGILCRSCYENASFAQVWKITGRDKNFKMQFYPSLAYIPVFIFIIFFRNFKDVDQKLADLPNGNMFLWLLYLGMFAVTLSLTLISYYENYTASWVYQTAPVNKPGELINGAIKALLVKFFIPIYLVMSTLTLVIWDYKTLDDVLLVGFNSILIFYISALMSTHYLPFSQQPNAKQQSGRFLMVLLRMFLIGILVALHWLALKISWLVIALVPLAFAGCWWLHQRVQQLPWRKIVM
ncbi:hypothetical protein U0035_20985 [Niabella yanshanensis]|uniref:ABC-2 type transport system permease protein n=1 Tax=Niabella yanshanensis TaxID=577386 RepID=A0ABZ0W9F1_9BACT|nr:hypothetical protein [Niabella yanshanensis]WQD38147.1 hypothetical protein U0035_20985 [Niabella yanshanensis]